MNTIRQIALIAATFPFAVPIFSQTRPDKPTFEVVSIRPSPPDLRMRGGGPRGTTYSMSGASLRMLLQAAYQPLNSEGQPVSQIQIFDGPDWIDSDRYDVQAKADCGAGAVSREQLRLMLQSMLEDRFQLKAHLEMRELSVYNLVVAKDGPKVKASEDQTPVGIRTGAPQLCGAVPEPVLPPAPPPPPGARGGPFDPGAALPRGAMLMMMNQTGLTMRATAVPLTSLISLLQQTTGRPIIDRTSLQGLFDFELKFSPEGLALPGPPPGAGPGPGAGLVPGPGPGQGGTPVPVAADPVPSLFSAIQDLGLKLESSKARFEVLVIDSVQKPTEN